MIKLFDEIERSYLGPSNNRENTYNYYNISGRKDISIVRNKLEDWFSEIPNSEKKEIKERFKKSFYAVFYELFLFHLFKNLGFEITFHPSVPNSNKRPDFLIKKGILEIYIEAKISKDKSQSEEANENRLNQFYDSLNKIKAPNFLLKIDHVLFKTEKQPKTKKLIKFLEDKLSQIDPDALTESLERKGFDGVLEIRYNDDEIDLQVKPIPVVPSVRKEEKRAIGMYPTESIIGGAEESLQDSISTKAKRYGKLDKPYIICVNALSIKSSSGFDIENAIWGSLAISFSTNPQNREEKWVRKPDGIFLNEKGERIKNVSGILVTRVFPHNIPNANYWLFKHPFSENDLDFDLIGIKYNYVENNIIIKNTGHDIDQILHISKDWLNG